ncbi:WYL domain-containing protein [Streptomyces sp. NBC_01476]|uniref:WYL domain-containing protein n=1 Tax=Streptomyces sp. NBC_01476 TaxID=2903881 RepID=UPI002E376280|nr:WYL domain-containing protein [Streptomyces sp. NBC_01476]
MTRTARRTLRTIRRSITAALHTSRHLVTAVRGARFGLLVRLYRAIDQGATVRIAYRDRDGVTTVRDVQPQSLQPTAAGDITVTAHDHLRGEKRTFRTDRIQLAA